jgi:DNA-binding transcriptional LysR family regulator
MLTIRVTTAACALAAGTLGLLIAITPASAQQDQAAARQACEPDAFRLCNDFIPDEGQVAACLRKKRLSLSPACRAFFTSSKSSKHRTTRR